MNAFAEKYESLDEYSFRADGVGELDDLDDENLDDEDIDEEDDLDEDPDDEEDETAGDEGIDDPSARS